MCVCGSGSIVDSMMHLPVDSSNVVPSPQMVESCISSGVSCVWSGVWVGGFAVFIDTSFDATLGPAGFIAYTLYEYVFASNPV